MKKLLCAVVWISLCCFSLGQSLHAAESPPAFNLPVNINAADADVLAAALKGIGLKKAEAIIRYRETVGGFKALEELTEVKGIGVALIETNRARMVLK